MNRPEPLEDPGRAVDSSPAEPSMEEILASIRRLITESEAAWEGARNRAAEEDGARADSRLGDTDPEAGLADEARIPAGNRQAGSEPVAQGHGKRSAAPALASAATAASVTAAFNALVASRFARNADYVADITREMIRPMLEAWIDAHLPEIVERLVAAEIERITKGD